MSGPMYTEQNSKLIVAKLKIHTKYNVIDIIEEIIVTQENERNSMPN